MLSWVICMLLWTIIIMSPMSLESEIECDTEKCSCAQKRRFWRFYCPPNGIAAEGNQISIQLSETYGILNLKCPNHLFLLNRTILPQVNMKGKISQLTVEKCRLPTDFQNILDYNFGLDNLTDIFFTWTKLENVTLDKDSFVKLDGLIKLDLQDNNFVQLNDEVFKNLPNLTYLNLNRNKLKDISDNLFDNLYRLESLALANNQIRMINNPFKNLLELTLLDLQSSKLQAINGSAFQNLKKLVTLRLDLNHLKNIPPQLFKNNPKLETIFLNDNYDLILTDYMFANLTTLKMIDLSSLGVSEIPPNIFHNCTNLAWINLKWNKLHKIPENLFNTNPLLENIQLNYNLLKTLPDDVFSSLKQLKYLSLEHNSIDNISDKVFRNLFELALLYLQYNKIKYIDTNAFKNNRKLELIDLSYNELTITELNTTLFKNCDAIYHVDLSHNKISKLSNNLNKDLANKRELKKLDLSHNFISQIDLKYFLIMNLEKSTYELEIDLRFNKISEVKLFETFEEAGVREPDLYRRIKIDISHNPFKCDCKILDLFYFLDQRANPEIKTLFNIRESNLIRCNQPRAFHYKPVNRLEPELLSCSLNDLYANYSGCPQGCLCDVQTYIKKITVNCSNQNLTVFPEVVLPRSLAYDEFELILNENSLENGPNISFKPQLDNVTKLVLSNNKIKDVSWLPSKLKILDLSGNHLEILGSTTMSEFELLENISLKSNPWSCDCDTKDLVNFLRNNVAKLDANSIKCNNTDDLLIDLDVTFLCYYFQIYATIAFLIVTIILATITTLYYRYREQIEIFLYANKICMCCIRSEEEIDKHKEFDAFISYSHKDEIFMNRILSVLENETNGYKVCIHHRDWIGGEFIPDQIVKSVLNSRRTIVILSNSFLQSVWGKHEFRTAHTEAMKEGRTRVIVILYEDISANVELLDDVLKTYIKYYTYIQWGDRWFWEKLLYAMPHQRLKNNSRTNRVIFSKDFQQNVSIDL